MYLNHQPLEECTSYPKLSVWNLRYCRNVVDIAHFVALLLHKLCMNFNIRCTDHSKLLWTMHGIVRFYREFAHFWSFSCKIVDFGHILYVLKSCRVEKLKNFWFSKFPQFCGYFKCSKFLNFQFSSSRARFRCSCALARPFSLLLRACAR